MNFSQEKIQKMYRTKNFLEPSILSYESFNFVSHIEGTRLYEELNLKPASTEGASFPNDWVGRWVLVGGLVGCNKKAP